MAYFYSPQTKGFYIDSIHKEMPKDVISISDDQYQMFMEGQSLGKEIVYKSRKLQLADRVVAGPTWDAIRSKRDNLLNKCDWTQMPDAQLTDEMRQTWRVYRQALRDLTETFSKPEDVVWPKSPNDEE